MDVVITKLRPSISRTRAAEIIRSGAVTVDGVIAKKPSLLVVADAQIELSDCETKYVSRAGFKLEFALDYFDIDVENLVVLDGGLSTGGFADCLLLRGAKKVVGVDVGHDQIHPKLKNDPRLVVMDGVDLRDLKPLAEPVDIITLDVSFISVLKVIKNVIVNLKPHGKLIVLIKPQFEVGRENIAKGGIVTDEEARMFAIDRIVKTIESLKFSCVGVQAVPAVGEGRRNIEYIGAFSR